MGARKGAGIIARALQVTPMMKLEAVLEAYAEYEKRAMRFYRKLSDRFVAESDASRLWLDLSNAEAGHFAALTLTVDRVAMAESRSEKPTEWENTLERLSKKMSALEMAGEDPGLTIGEAVRLSVLWEELELPGIIELFPHLGDRAKGELRSSILSGATRHYQSLADLVKVAGRNELIGRIEALKTEASAQAR